MYELELILCALGMGGMDVARRKKKKEEEERNGRMKDPAGLISLLDKNDEMQHWASQIACWITNFHIRHSSGRTDGKKYYKNEI